MKTLYLLFTGHLSGHLFHFQLDDKYGGFYVYIDAPIILGVLYM